MRGQNKQLLRAYKEKLPVPEFRCKKQVDCAVAVLHEHLFVEVLTLNWLKETCNINRKNFSARFKACLGRYPKDYITHHRIEASKWLLSRTRARISQIALEVGFSSLSAYANTFKNKTGMRPSEWRQVNGGQ